ISRSRCKRPQYRCDSIEYCLSQSQLTFLILSRSKSSKHAHPTLFTFPGNATLKLITNHKDFIKCTEKQSHVQRSNVPEAELSAHFELDGVVLDENTQFSSIENIATLLVLVILPLNDRLHFHKTEEIDLNVAALEKHRNKIHHRLPLENGHRLKSHKIFKYPNNSLDLLFDTLHGQLTYLTGYLKSHFVERHQFTTYLIQQYKGDDKAKREWKEWETGIYKMLGDEDGTINISVASDWGAGTLESSLVASAMMNGLDTTVQQQQATPNLPHYSIHLGDIYYVGLPTEVQHCCLGVKPHWAEQGVFWPIGQNGSFSIPGNHELYSGGYGYWDYFLPRLGLFDPNNLTKPIHSQKTSYWVLENDYWRVIGLDTGYDSYSLLSFDNSAIRLPDELMDWLKNVVGLNPDMTDKRGLLFFSHHQVVSAWDQKPYTAFPEQLASLLPDGRTVLYLWGHEHRLSFYEKQTTRPISDTKKSLTFYGRCVGNSGFPTLATELPIKARETLLLFYDDRLYKVDGKNAYINIALGFNGFVSMKFVKPKEFGDTSLFIHYKTLSLKKDGHLTDENPTLLVNEEWGVDVDGNVMLIKLQTVNEELTKSVHIANKRKELTLTQDEFACDSCTTL
ncbi:unnamed protein product, partial [Didymodactylos carnosus]